MAKNTMSKEFDIVEINVEIVDNDTEQVMTKLTDLALALVGGGSATVNF